MKSNVFVARCMNLLPEPFGETVILNTNRVESLIFEGHPIHIIRQAFADQMETFTHHLMSLYRLGVGVDDPHNNHLKKRLCIYNDAESLKILESIQEAVAGLTGKSLKPHCTFSSLYSKGAVLPPHVDREHYDLTLSIMYHPVEAGPLTLGFSSGDATKEISLTYGDAVIFPGQALKHWRRPLAHRAGTALFHYRYRDNT